MSVRVWNPVLAADPDSGDGYAEIEESALPAHRNAGWLLASEREDHEAAVEAHRARAERAGRKGRGGKAAEETPAEPDGGDQGAEPAGAADTQTGAEAGAGDGS